MNPLSNDFDKLFNLFVQQRNLQSQTVTLSSGPVFISTTG